MNKLPSSLDWRQRLRPRRRVLKFTKPNPNNNGGLILKIKFPHCNKIITKASTQILSDQSNGFESSHGSSWFRGALLGKGGFGSVFLAKPIINLDSDSDSSYLLPSQIAVKSSFVEDSSSLRFEKKVLDELCSYPYVVQCYGDEITKTKSGKPVYNLLLEYCSGGSLFDRIAKFEPRGLPELEVQRYTRDIVFGIAYIHGRRFIHCDIKPDNILLMPSIDEDRDCMVAKIADFGLAEEMIDGGSSSGIKGSVPYMAPELVRENHFDWPIDIWAVGCVVFEMLTGKGVWSSSLYSNSDDLLALIGYSNKLPEIPSGLSPTATDFLRRCLVRSPYARSPAFVLIRHPFISLHTHNDLRL